MNRRNFLRGLAAISASSLMPGPASAATRPTVLAAAWYASGELPAPFSQGVGHYVGVLQIDWSANEIRMLGAQPVPHRPHGIVAAPDHSGFYAVAFRHGGWLLHADRNGQVVGRIDSAAPDGKRTFDGHIEISPDGKWLFTTEADVASGQGWVSVRSARTLARVGEFPTYGIDPHQLLLDDEGMVVIANGGIDWTLDNQKRNLDRMDSSLVRINAENGELLGQWRLRDKRLSMRHIAWNTTPAGQRVLGIAMHRLPTGARAGSARSAEAASPSERDEGRAERRRVSRRRVRCKSRAWSRNRTPHFSANASVTFPPVASASMYSLWKCSFRDKYSRPNASASFSIM